MPAQPLGYELGMPKLSRLLLCALAASLTACVTERGRSEYILPDHPIVELEDPYPDNIAGFQTQIGISEFEGTNLPPFEHPSSLGILYRSYLDWEPFELEIGGGFGYEVEDEGGAPLNRLRLYEANIGLGMTVPMGPRGRPSLEGFFGSGLAWVAGRTDVESGSGVDKFDDVDTGYYVHGGVRFYLQRRQYISIDWRILRDIDLSFGGVSRSADLNTVSIGFGVSF